MFSLRGAERFTRLPRHPQAGRRTATSASFELTVLGQGSLVVGHNPPTLEDQREM